MQRIHSLAIVALLGCGSGQHAAPTQPPAHQDAPAVAQPVVTQPVVTQPVVTQPVVTQPTTDVPKTPDDRKALMRQLRTEREAKVRERGEIFARIAVKHDFTGEHVVFRDKDVTAFLDLKDPQHPRYKPDHDEDEDGPKPDGSNVRAHILVVPNQARETIGMTVASNITTDDLELTLKVMRAATALSTRLGIKNAKVYVKSPARVGVGYLHVHIIGQRSPKTPYPPALK